MSEPRVKVVQIRGNTAELIVDGRSVIVPFLQHGTRISFSFDGETYVVDLSDQVSRRRAGHRDHSMSAPMPGVVLKIMVKPGQQVKKGTPLVILEAMKMEHVIVAPYDGTVHSIDCKEGELVQPGADLIELTANS